MLIAASLLLQYPVTGKIFIKNKIISFYNMKRLTFYNLLDKYVAFRPHDNFIVNIFYPSNLLHEIITPQIFFQHKSSTKH